MYIIRMNYTHAPSPAGEKTKRAVTLTVSRALMDQARLLGINASRAAEAGIAEEVRRTRAIEWLKANQAALAAHNARLQEEGLFFTPDWTLS